MDVEQRGACVFRILRSEGGGWIVTKDGVKESLASFGNRQDACDYANRSSIASEGSTVLMLDESNPASSKF